MPVESHRGAWRASVRKDGRRVRGPVRRLRAEADIDLSQLQNACSEGLAALVAAHAAMSAAASSRQQDLQEERPAMPAANASISGVGISRTPAGKQC